MPEEEANLFDSVWGKFIGAALFIGSAYWMHGIFSELEAGTRESARVNALVALAYKTIGHWPTVGLLALAGLLALVFGIRQLVSD